MKLLTLLVPLSLLLSGCLVESENPLSPPGTAAADAKLQGVWTASSEDGQNYLVFAASEKSPGMEIASIDRGKKGGLDLSKYTMFPSAVGGAHFMNLQKAEDSDRNYIFARYELSAKSLTIWLMSEDAVAAAIEAGKLKGEVKGSGTNRDVKLTDSTENLARFVSGAEGKATFSKKFGTFKKLVE